MARSRRRPELQREGQVRCRFCGGFYDPALPECPNCGYQTQENQNYATDWRTIGPEACAGGFGGPKSPIQIAARCLGGLLIGLLVAVAVVNIGKSLYTAPPALPAAASISAPASSSVPADPTSSGTASASEEKTKADEPKKAKPNTDDDQSKLPVTLNLSDMTLMSLGDSYHLVADGGGGHYTWTIDNSAVATVNDGGVVTAVSRGDATVTCTGENGNTAVCRVHVT